MKELSNAHTVESDHEIIDIRVFDEIIECERWENNKLADFEEDIVELLGVNFNSISFFEVEPDGNVLTIKFKISDKEKWLWTKLKYNL